MPLEILTGPDVPALLARAQQRLGDDAVVMSVRRIVDGNRHTFEVVAADPATAERQRQEQASERSAFAARTAWPAPPNAETLARVTYSPARRGAQAPATRRADAPDDGARFWDLARAPLERTATAPPAPKRGLWPFRSAPAPAPGGRPRVIALVGPTGAGKTTTIAKLANHPQGFAGRKVGLVCLDTYRIGAVEQSRQYAELSKLPLEVVWDAPDAARAVRRLRGCDVVLVDTPGRGPRASADLRETQTRLLELLPDEVHLVLPAGLQRALARRIVTAHLPLGVTHLLPTKLDEFPDERGLFEIAAQFALPMRWLTDGQEVPRDLQLAPATPLEAVTSGQPLGAP